MIFERKNGDTDWGDLYCNRYTAREEAMKNHRRIIEAFKNNQVSVTEHELEISL
jgi:N-dimethylarginine dimethylaminohydrolase